MNMVNTALYIKFKQLPFLTSKIVFKAFPVFEIYFVFVDMDIYLS